MELLRKKDFNMGDCNYSISLFKQNEGFVVRADVPKDMDFKKNVVFENLIGSIKRVCTNIDLKILYVPNNYEIVENESFIDIYYPIAYMLDGDEEYITDDNEVGKELLSVEMVKELEDRYIFDISFNYLAIVKHGRISFLWDFDSAIVSKFLKSEIISVME